MPGLVIVGIDSMDKGLVHSYRKRMPNLHRLIDSGISIPMVSTMPPDSVTAWASIYTGMNPAEHGIVTFADPLEKVKEIATLEPDNRILVGNTFWDDASRASKRVCVINPNTGYPPWKVNGIMIGRSQIQDDVACEPDGAVHQELLDGLTAMRGLPGGNRRGLRDGITRAKTLVERERRLAVELLRRENWDLFFVYSSVLDWIQHIFWSHCDKEDPAYPGPNEFDDTIPLFYEIYDQFIGDISEELRQGQRLMVMSDHGHGRRPLTLLNFNIILAEKGLLSLRKNMDRRQSSKVISNRIIRSAAGRIVNDFRLGNLAASLMKAFPGSRRALMKSEAIDWDRTYAYVSDQSGLKAYNYGGIAVKMDPGAPEGDYDARRIHVLEAAKETKIPTTGEFAFKWAKTREELYNGPFISKYPGVVAVLNDDYGFGWEATGPLISRTKTHNIQPGSHKIDTPILIISPVPEEFAQMHDEVLELMDLRRVIGQMIGVPIRSEAIQATTSRSIQNAGETPVN